MAFSGKFLGVQDTLQTNFGSGVHTLAEVGQGVKDGVWPTNYKINQSLRFQNSTSSYLTRTVGDGNQTTFTVSGWYKKVKSPTTYQNVWSSQTSGSDYFVITIGDYTGLNETFRIQSYNGTEQFLIRTSAVYRDYNQWYHFTVTMDTTQPVESDRAKIYINGELITEFNNVSYPTQNLDLRVNGTSHNVGTFNTAQQFFDGYIAEINFIDGLALDASYFGFTHPTTKKWLPKKYTGEYGAMGYHLDFAGTNVGTGALGTVGEDKSGNGNHFTSSGINHYDVVPDSPTNNFATLNELMQDLTSGTGTLSEGNLRLTVTESTYGTNGWRSSIAGNNGCNWYAEMLCVNSVTSVDQYFRFILDDYDSDSRRTSYRNNGTFYDESLSGNQTYATWTSGDIIGGVFNFNANEVQVYKNGVFQGGVPVRSVNGLAYYFGTATDNQSGTKINHFNFGQDATFSGAKTLTKVYTDANGRGQFFYEPPAGALALCSANLEQAKNTPTEYITDETDQHMLTYNGSAGVNKFSPYATDGYSVNFPYNSRIRESSVTLGTSDFTITAFVYVSPVSGEQRVLGNADQGLATEHQIIINTSDQYQIWTGSSWANSSTKVKWNTWHRIDMVRSGSTLKLYQDGVEIISTTNGNNLSKTYVDIGARNDGAGYLNGYISNLRYVIGSAITPPTSNVLVELDAVTNTALLCFKSKTFVDVSGNNKTLSIAAGSPEISDFSPFSPDPNIVTQDLTLNGGGSFYFDGSGDYLKTGYTLDFNTNFTIQGWFFCNGLGNDANWVNIFSNNRGDATGIRLDYNVNTGSLEFGFGNGGTWVNASGLVGTVKKLEWNYFMITWDGTTYKMFLNDNSTPITWSESTGSTTTQELYLGRMRDADTRYYWGYISDFRILRGTVLDYEYPSSKLSTITNTKLLLQPYSKVKPSKGIFNRIDAYPYEETEKSLIYNSGISVVDTSPYKSGDIGSFGFDGTNNSQNGPLKLPKDQFPFYNIGTNDFTMEWWFKMNVNNGTGASSYQGIFWGGDNGYSSDELHIAVNNSTIQIYLASNWQNTGFTPATGVWYHFALVRDYSGNSFKMYINGNLEYSTTTGAQNNYDQWNNNSTLQYNCHFGNHNSYSAFEGPITDIRFINNQKLYTSAFTPPAYPLRSDYYTTDGSDPATSGTRSAISGTVALLAQPGKREDKSEVFKFASLIKNNYSGTGITLANNGYSVTSTAIQSVHSSFSVSSGKWYVEVSGTAGTAGGYIGVQEANTASPNYAVTMSNLASQGIGLWPPSGYIYGGNGTSAISGISAPGTALVATDVVGMAIDMDASPKTVQWLVNNTRVITVKLGSTEYIAADGTTGTATATFADINNLYVTYNAGATGTRTADWNFGQDPTILGNVTPSGGTNADNGFPDEDGNGSFRYAPPAGYKAMGKYEKPQKLVSDPALHPEKYFNTVLYRGNGLTNQISGVGFKPDFIWLKNRTSTGEHLIHDHIRGLGNIRSNSTAAESAGGTIHLASYDNDGFTVTGSGGNSNSAGDDYVAWCWKAGDEIVPNTDGTIPALVSANKDAGFSIISYTGNGNTSGATIGHGLGDAPDFVIVKNRTTATVSTNAWQIYHRSAGTGFLNFDSSAYNSTGNRWDSSHPTSSLISLGGDVSVVNCENNVQYICYAWHSVPGFSKFGSYTGNGNADGPFIYLGFRPAWVMIKHSSGSVSSSYTSWMIVDNTRDTYNPTTNILWANRNASEGYRGDGSTALSGDIGYVDFLSNGFKIRDTNSAELNDSSDVYIFAAFAEAPFSRSTAR